MDEDDLDFKMVHVTDECKLQDERRRRVRGTEQYLAGRSPRASAVTSPRLASVSHHVVGSVFGSVWIHTHVDRLSVQQIPSDPLALCGTDARLRRPSAPSVGPLGTSQSA